MTIRRNTLLLKTKPYKKHARCHYYVLACMDDSIDDNAAYHRICTACKKKNHNLFFDTLLPQFPQIVNDPEISDILAVLRSCDVKTWISS